MRRASNGFFLFVVPVSFSFFRERRDAPID